LLSSYPRPIFHRSSISAVGHPQHGCELDYKFLVPKNRDAVEVAIGYKEGNWIESVSFAEDLQQTSYYIGDGTNFPTINCAVILFMHDAGV
jgi:hypothetical protein